jgi:hypothetical protein
MSKSASCPECGSTDNVWSQERVTALYRVEPAKDGEGWAYAFASSEVLDDTAESFGLYCRDCDTEFEGELS